MPSNLFGPGNKFERSASDIRRAQQEAKDRDIREAHDKAIAEDSKRARKA